MIGIANAISLGMSGASGGAPAFHPSDVAGCIEFWDSTVPGDRVMSGSNLTSWTGRLGGHILLPAGTGNIIELPAEINAQPVIQTNGTTNWLECSTVTLPTPATTPTWIVAFWRIDTISSFDQVFGAKRVGGYNISIFSNGSGAGLQQSNGTSVNSNAGPGLGAWERLEAYFDGSGSPGTEYLKRRATSVNTGNPGNTTPAAGIVIGTRGNGDATTFCRVSLGALGLYSAQPSAPNKTLIDGWHTSTFGAGYV